MSTPEPTLSTPQSGRVFVPLLAVLNILALLTLLAGGWLSYGYAGSMNLGDISAAPLYDRVQYSLLGYSYLGGHQVLGGPHRPLTWALLWLLMMTAAWGVQAWRHRASRSRFRRGAWIWSVALLLSLLVCLLVLPAAQLAHTAVLHTYGPRAWVTASNLWLEGLAYARCTDVQGCQQVGRSVFLNPFAAALALIAAAGVLVSWPPSQQRD